jgi:hypothetical protein
MSLEDRSPPLFTDFLPPPPLGVNSTTSDLVYPPDASSSSLSLHDSDLSRKRCASALDAERPLKSLKSEPLEDAGPMYPPPPGPPPSTGGSTSSESTGFVFNPPRRRPSSGTVVSPYSSSGATSPDMMDITGSQMPSSMISQPSFPLMRNSWSDSVVTRHAHSSSTGSIASSALPNASMLGKYTSSAVNGAAETIGRMSRSGSITGNFNNPFPGAFPQASFQDPSGQWPSSGMPTSASDTFPLRPTVPSVPASAPPTWPPLSKASADHDENSDESDDEGSPLNGNAAVRNDFFPLFYNEIANTFVLRAQRSYPQDLPVAQNCLLNIGLKWTASSLNI